MKRSAAVVIALPVFVVVFALEAAGCSLLLDFDLTGNSPADDDASSSSLDGGGSDATPSDAMTDGDVIAGGPQEAPLQCGQSFDYCDGFERDEPVGEKFRRKVGQGVLITATHIASDTRSLEVVRPKASGPEEVFLASEANVFPQNKGRFTLLIWFAIEYDANTFSQDRTLIIIRPTATIDLSGEERVKVVMRTGGLFVEARQFNGGPAWASFPIDKAFNLANGRYHAFAIDLDFVAGSIVLGLDGVDNVINQTGLVLLSGPLLARYSFAFGASTEAAGGAITARFDNVRVRHH